MLLPMEVMMMNLSRRNIKLACLLQMFRQDVGILFGVKIAEGITHFIRSEGKRKFKQSGKYAIKITLTLISC